jgi:mono/diheme cytochrome c family protein
MSVQMDRLKKLLKRVFAIIGGVFALAVIGVLVKFYALSPKSRPAPVMTAPTNSEAVARGKYLVNNVAACIGCHSQVQEDVSGEPPVEGKVGSGRDFGDTPGPVHIRAPNITPDKQHGIGDWTDGEIARAIREGVSKDGRGLFPQMPYLTYRETLSDGEVLDIIAYLRTLKPVSDDLGRTSVGFPVSMFIRGVPQPLDQPPPPPPGPSDKMARGKWLLKVASCHDCHDSRDAHMEKIPGKEFGGGMRFTNPKGTVYASNISSDKATGIGAYTPEDLRRVLDEGKGKAGNTTLVMPWGYYKGMTSEDKDALIAALMVEPAVANIVPARAVK